MNVPPRNLRILVVTNLYPPHSMGGYEERCRCAVEGLRARGHTLTVLTSAVRFTDRPDDAYDYPVHRTLIPVGFFGYPWTRMPKLGAIEAANHAALRTLAQDTQADLVWVWNLGGLGKSLLLTAAASAPLVCDISDHWVLRGIPADPWLMWCRRHPHLARVHRWLRPSVPSCAISTLPLGAAYCTSLALRELTVGGGFSQLNHCPIIPCGVAIDRFTHSVHQRDAGPLRLVYAGRLHPDKGIATACTAVSHVPGVQLDIIGAGDKDYEQQLRATFSDQPCLRFLGRRNAHDMPGCYPGYHGLIFPSEWAEPFALTPLEASCAGLAVVGTTTGGSGEFLIDGETALCFRAGDVADAVRAIIRLRDDPLLGQHIATRAQQVVRERYSERTMIDALEYHLRTTVTQAKGAA